MRKTTRFLSLLVLLMMAATGAWAQTTPTEVSTFAGLQTALSAGNDVKLTANIQFTSAIEISGSKKILIDGNGKKMSGPSTCAFTISSGNTLAIKNATIDNFDRSAGGGAIRNYGTLVLDGCTVSNNHTDGNGQGGGAIENQGTLYASNTTFSGNYSSEIGGAINNYGGNLYLSGCTFTNNYTTSSNANYGGAIGNNSTNTLVLVNCTFSGNKYGGEDGTTGDLGVYTTPGTYTIAGCTGITIDGATLTTYQYGTAKLDYADLNNIVFTYDGFDTPTVTVTHSDQSVTEYSSLAAAFALTGTVNTYLQDGDVVTLLADQEGLTEEMVLNGKQITVDLNGHTVTSSETVFFLNSSADLTLTSSQEGGAINVTFADNDDNEAAIWVYQNCKLTIPESSQHFTISTNKIAIFDVGEVVIDGSPTINATQAGLYSAEATWSVTATISGSPTITSDAYGIYVLSPSCQISISGAPTISGKANGIFAYCLVTISGQPTVTSEGATGPLGFPFPYDIMAFQLTIGGTAEHPATIDFTGSTATGNIIVFYPITIDDPVALGGQDKWKVDIMDTEGFPTTGTFTSGWATNMSGAAITDYFAGGQLTNGTNLIVSTDDSGEGVLVATYAVSLNDGEENPTTWTAKAGDATTFTALPQNVAEGQTVTLKYDGRRKVKAVTATVDAQPVFAADEYNEASWNGTKVVLTKKKAATTPTAVEDASSDVTWNDGWYTVTGNVNITGKVTLGADTHLILGDGAKLTINGNIYSYGYNLYIYGQEKGNGKLNISGSEIGIDCSYQGTIVEIHGGDITIDVTGSSKDGVYVDGINVYGGKLSATSNAEHGISFLNTINVYGGELEGTSNSTNTRFGICGFNAYTLIVHGGKVKGTGSSVGYGMGFNGKLLSGTDNIKFYFSNDGTTWESGISYTEPTKVTDYYRYAKAE